MIRWVVVALLLVYGVADAGMSAPRRGVAASGGGTTYDTTKPTSTSVSVVDGDYSLGSTLSAAYIFNEGTGTAVTDYVGTNDGTLSGSWNSSNAGVHFTNTTDKVTLSSAFVWQNGTAGKSVTFRARQSAADNNGIIMGSGDGSSYLWLHNGVIRWNEGTDYTVTTSTYHTYTLTRSSTGYYTLYIDGSQAIASTWVTNISYNYSVIGSGYAAGDILGLTGDVDFFYVHNKELSSTEAANIYTHPYSMFED